MTYQPHCTVPKEILEQIASEGIDALPELLRVLINSAMQAEREKYLGVGAYERSAQRQGHASGDARNAARTRWWWQEGQRPCQQTEGEEGPVRKPGQACGAGGGCGVRSAAGRSHVAGATRSVQGSARQSVTDAQVQLGAGGRVWHTGPVGRPAPLNRKAWSRGLTTPSPLDVERSSHHHRQEYTQPWL